MMIQGIRRAGYARFPCLLEDRNMKDTEWALGRYCMRLLEVANERL